MDRFDGTVFLRHKIADAILILFLLIIVYFGACYVFNILYSTTLKFHAQKTEAKYQQCLQLHPFQPKKTVRILVISGGGINGLIPLAFLDYIEKKTGRPIHDLFDLLMATSTGTIIESLINLPNKDGHFFSAHELYDKYIEDAKDYLSPSYWRRFLTLDGLMGPKLEINQIYSNLRKNPYMDRPFYQIKKDMVFTNTRLNDLTLTFLRTWNCDNSRIYSPLAEIITSTTALPLVFSPIDYFDEFGNKSTYADGALYANRPFLEAIRFAKERNPSVEKIIIVFISTGTLLRIPDKWDGSSFDHWGLIKWLPAVVKIMFTAQQYEAHEGIRALIDYLPQNHLKYYHLNSNWTKDPLNITDENIKELDAAAQQGVVDNFQKLDELIHDINY